MDTTSPIKALILNSSLTPTPGDSSTEKLASQVADELKAYNVDSAIIRAVDYNIKPGVETDMGKGDDWPKLRKQMLESDIFILATPTWVGQMSSVGHRIIERLDAELSETDDEGRLLTFGKVAGVVIVGNEDGAHKITADALQALNDVGFTIPAGAATYWNGEAMQKVDYKDLTKTPEPVTETNKTMAAHLAHTARLLKEHPYPPLSQS